MLITYQYKLNPTLEQASTMEVWGELLCRHYNYALGVARERKEFHYQVAHWLCDQYDLIAFENLNIGRMSQSVPLNIS